MKIVAIAGSLRKESYNLKLARATEKLVKEIDPSVQFEILDWSGVPLLNQDLEHPAPQPVTEIRNSILSADGVWFFTPEYNHALPGVLKNLIDWLSRPVSETQKQVLLKKPVAFSGASESLAGTVQSQDALVPLLSLLGARVMPVPRLALSRVNEKIDENGVLQLGSSQPYLERQIKAFIKFIKIFD